MNTIIEVTDDFIITVKDLKRLNACKEAIKFVERNDLEGVRLKDVKGSYEFYVSWLSARKYYTFEINSKDQLVSTRDRDNGTLIHEFEYDSKGNIVWEKGIHVGSCTHEYDANNNRISTTHSGGTRKIMKYDARGNMLSESRGGTYYTYSWGYDNKGNKIFETYRIGKLKSQYKYDDIGNKVCKICPSGLEFSWKYTRTTDKYFIITKDDREVLKVDLAYKNSKNAKST